MRWSFIVFTFSQKCWNFSTDVLNLRWNLIKIALKFYYFTFSQERWKFITDVFNLCWNFARNALKFYCFHVFSGALKIFYGCGEFGLKLCKKCAEILLLSRFLKSAEICLLMCWICVEILRFLKSSKFLYGCAEFVLKLCKKMRWNYIILRFLQSAEIFLRMCWTCVETL